MNSILYYSKTKDFLSIKDSIIEYVSIEDSYPLFNGDKMTLE